MSRRRRAMFTAEEDAVIRKYYSETGATGCARRINKTVKQIWNRAYLLGVSKPRSRVERQVVAAAHRYDHRALARALGTGSVPPLTMPARVHRLKGGASW